MNQKLNKNNNITMLYDLYDSVVKNTFKNHK